MIPKQLFFIWFGDTQPNYVNFSIDAFKRVNPDFKINFLRYTVGDIENKNKVSEFDHNVYNCLDYILNNGPKYLKSIQLYKNNKRKIIQILANIVRLDVLNEYGGIYLDCDTFPIKPFDEWLLNRQNFSAYVSYDNIEYKDCFFLGSDGKIFKEFYGFMDDNIAMENDWNVKRKMFFNCCYNYTDYIYHFEDKTWYNRSPISKFD
jgi:hypothetical protein